VWLRHAFPFELLSSSDSFVLSDVDKTSLRHPRSSSPYTDNFTERGASGGSVKDRKMTRECMRTRSPNTSTSPERGSSTELQSGRGQNISVSVREISSSTCDEGNVSKYKEDMSPISAEQNSSLKITGISNSSGHSSSPSPKEVVGTKFGIFNKIKSSLSKQKKESDSGNDSKGSSPVQVGSYSSSSKESSSSSFVNAIRSQFKLGSYSSSLKGSSSGNTSSTTPVILVDITENDTLIYENRELCSKNGQSREKKYSEKSKDCVDIKSEPKSEGFEIHGTAELERTLPSEGSKSQNGSKKKRKLKKSKQSALGKRHLKLCVPSILK